MKAIIEKDLSFLENEDTIPTKEEIKKLFELVKINQNQGIILLEYFNNVSEELSEELKLFFIKEIEENIEVTGNSKYVFNMTKEEEHDFSNHKLKVNNKINTPKQINNQK